MKREGRWEVCVAGEKQMGAGPIKLGRLGYKAEVGVGGPKPDIHIASSLTVGLWSFVTLSTPLSWPSRINFKQGVKLWMGLQSIDVTCTPRGHNFMNLAHWERWKEIGGECRWRSQLLATLVRWWCYKAENPRLGWTSCLHLEGHQGAEAG